MTRDELTQRLRTEGFRPGIFFAEIATQNGRPAVFRNDGAPQDDCFTVRERDGAWAVEFLERGSVTSFGEFGSEADACARVYALIAADPTARQSGSAR